MSCKSKDLKCSDFSCCECANSNFDFNDKEEIRLLKFIEPYIYTIKCRFDKITFREDTIYNRYTSYTVNKGEEIVMCMRDKKTGKLHNINELMYVAIHELAHVGCPLNGHPPLFVDINKILLIYATYFCNDDDNCKIYKYCDYDVNSKKYCGMEIDATILNSRFNSEQDVKNICLQTEDKSLYNNCSYY